MTLKDTAQGLINKFEHVLDNKKQTSSTTPGTTSTTTTGGTAHQVENPSSTNHGPHSSNLANKADPRIDSDLDGRQTTHSHGNTNTLGSSTGPSYSSTSNTAFDNSRSTNAGPHDSNIANKLDPRVDSDRDGRNDPTSRTGGYGNTQTEGTYGTHSTSTATGGGSSAFNSHQSTNAGPHSSNIANKLDPRVDSDRDGRNDPTSRVGGYGDTATTNTYGNTSHTTSTGTTSNFNNNPQSTNAGPHSSNLLNKVDPRVDSDRDGRNDPTSRVGGYGNTQNETGYSGGSNTYPGTTTTHAGGASTLGDNPRSTNAGPHGSNLLNKLDPRVDSDRDGSGARGPNY